MQIFRKQRILIGSIAAASILGMCGCTAQQAKQLPTLVIGYDDYRPYNYVDEEGNQAGIDAELAKEACKRMGYEPVFQSIQWDKKDEYLANGEVDCLWSCFSMNGRDEDYSWVGPYMYSRQVVAVLEDSPIQSLADLTGKKIVVKVSTKPESIFLDRTDSAIPQVKTVYCLTDVNEVVTALRNEYVDACAGHAATLTYLLKNAGVDYRFLDEELLRSELGVAFLAGSDDAVQEKLEEALQEMKEDGTTARILSEYGLNAEKALGEDGP